MISLTISAILFMLFISIVGLLLLTFIVNTIIETFKAVTRLILILLGYDVNNY